MTKTKSKHEMNEQKTKDYFDYKKKKYNKSRPRLRDVLNMV